MSSNRREAHISPFKLNALFSCSSAGVAPVRIYLLPILLLGSSTLWAEVLLLRSPQIELVGVNVQEGNFQLLMDDLDATNFCTVEDGTIRFQNPFPGSREVFSVTVIEVDSGEQLYQAEYRLAKPGETFDSIEVTTSGQLDSSYVDEEQPEPFEEDPDFPFDGSTSNADLLGALQLHAVRGSFSNLTDLEVVNRTDPDATLRYNGPHADVSQFHMRNEIRTGAGSTFYMRAGDIDLSASNELVNQGLASRGISVGYVTPGERLKIEAGRVYGTDIVGTVRGPIAWSNESYRTGINAEFIVMEAERFSWSLHGAMVDVERPAQDNFGVAETPTGETNTVTGLGTTVGLLAGRLQLSLNWASSDYNNPAELNSDNQPDQQDVQIEGQPYEIYDPGVTKGEAYSHKLTWDAWSGELANRYASVGFEAGTSRASPLYRSLHGSGTADRREWSTAVNLSYGPVSGRISTTQYRNNLDDLISIHTLDEALHEASFDIELGERKYLPSQLGISALIEDMKTLNGDVIILAPVIEGLDFMDQTTETYGLTLTWQGNRSNTALELGYTFLDIDQRERANADRRDINYGLSHDITAEQWTLGGRLNFSYTDDLDDASRSKTSVSEWGLSASYAAEHGVSYSFNFDNNKDRLRDFVFNEQERSNSDRYSVSADFGQYFERIFNLGTTPSVVTSWQKTDTESVSNYNDSVTSSSSLTINLGLSF